ncbi:hypothetical protein [Streptomyces sp. NPDC058595]
MFEGRPPATGAGALLGHDELCPAARVLVQLVVQLVDPQGPRLQLV